MNTLVEWLAGVAEWIDSLGVWTVWIGLLLVLGALPSLLPRSETDRGPRGVIALWVGLLGAALLAFRGDALLTALGRARVTVSRGAESQANRLDPLLAKLPEGTSAWLTELPWREIAVAGLVLALVLTFYLPRSSRFGHER